MIRWKIFAFSGVAAALVTTGTVSESSAEEPGTFTNYYRGATQGLALGALPPPGVYTNLEVAASALGNAGGGAGRGNQSIPGAASAPVFGYGIAVLFVPGWTFLGASYGAGIIQGGYLSTVVSSLNPPFATNEVSSQLANTSVTPIDLSWNLGHGLFGALAFSVVGPDGSRWRTIPTNFDANPDYWSFQPSAALSYIDANWLLSANFTYSINTASPGVTALGPLLGPAGNGFISGNELYGDLTALYKWGKWEFGPVGFFKAQTTVDRPGGGIPCTPGLCGFQSNVAVGGLVGYDFGPVALQIWADETVECANAICGFDAWGRVSFKIWGPDAVAAKPLVAKN